MDISVLNKFKILLLENAISVYFHQEDNCIYAAWPPNQTQESLETGFKQLLTIIQKGTYPKLINDFSNTLVQDSDDLNWDHEQIGRGFGKTSLKYLAWVYPPQMTNHLIIDKIIHHIPAPIIAIGFDQLPTAQAWIHSV